MGKVTIRKKLNKIRESFYFRPQALLNWAADENGEPITDKRGNKITTVEEYESDWGELFFDLIYVAMAFELGDIIFDQVDKQEYGTGILFVVPIYISLNDVWADRVYYTTRYNAIGIYHQLLDILEALSVAWATTSIGSVEEFLDVDIRKTQIVLNATNTSRRLAEESEFEPTGYNYALAFSLTVGSYYFVQTLRGLELMYFGEFKDDLGDPQSIVNDGMARVQTSLIKFTVYLVAAIASGLGYIYETAWLWLAAVYSVRLLIVLRIFFIRNYTFDFFTCKHGKLNLLPVHIPAVIKRYGEWGMLMLGEGVLQIIIQEVTDDHAATHNLTFGFCFLILSLIQLTYFNNMPGEAKRHVMRRNGMRGIIWSILTPYFSGSFVVVGVGLKSVLKKHFKIGDPKSYDLVRFSWLLCIGLTGTFMFMFWLKALHPGFRNIFVDVTSTLAWLSCFGLSLSFLLLPLFNPSGLLLVALCSLIIFLIYLASSGTNEYEDEVEVSAKIAEVTGEEITEEELETLRQEEANMESILEEEHVVQQGESGTAGKE